MSEDSNSNDDEEPILSDDSHLDWNSYSEYLHQKDHDSSDEAINNQDISTFEEDGPIKSFVRPDKEEHILDDEYEPNMNRRCPKVEDWL